MWCQVWLECWIDGKHTETFCPYGFSALEVMSLLCCTAGRHIHPRHIGQTPLNTIDTGRKLQVGKDWTFPTGTRRVAVPWWPHSPTQSHYKQNSPEAWTCCSLVRWVFSHKPYRTTWSHLFCSFSIVSVTDVTLHSFGNLLKCDRLFAKTEEWVSSIQPHTCRGGRRRRVLLSAAGGQSGAPSYLMLYSLSSLHSKTLCLFKKKKTERERERYVCCSFLFVTGFTKNALINYGNCPLFDVIYCYTRNNPELTLSYDASYHSKHLFKWHYIVRQLISCLSKKE